MTFEQRIENGIFPSKQQFIDIHDKNMSRQQICDYFGFSVSTYKKLRKYYNLSPKKRVITVPFSEERKKATQNTLIQRYGEYGSEQRNEFYKRGSQKAKETCMLKYGFENPSLVPEFVDKRINTYIERYGVDNPMKSEHIRNKALETDIEKYGGYHISSPETRKKSQETILQKYGTLNIWDVPSIIKKRDLTNFARYGNTCVLCNPEIREKGYQTMLQNGIDAVKSSSQQIYINNLFGGMLNYPYGYYHIDSFLEKDGIGIEYSGGGHDLAVKTGRYSEQEFLGKERARKQYFLNHKIPILEFISLKDKLPDDEILISYLNMAKTFFQQGGLYYKVDLDNFSIYCE